MHRASTTLSTTRLDKELTYDEISKRTKIPIKYLEAIEAENTQNLPNEPYCSLIVKDYAESLGLNGSHLLSLFRRDVLTPRRLQPTSRKILSFTPQLALTLVMTISFLTFAGYLFYEYNKFNRPPSLKIDWPEKINDSKLEITGITDPEATIRVNDSLVIVDANGHFSKKINIDTNPAKIIIESKSRGGKTTVEEKTY